MTYEWTRIARTIQADALGDLQGHKKLQSPEGQGFLGALKGLAARAGDTAEELYPWLAREFRKGRLIHDDPHLFGRGEKGDYPLTPELLRHWSDWHRSPDRRKVSLDQVYTNTMPDEIEAWEKEKADKAEKAQHGDAMPLGEVVHQFPDGWTVRNLPSEALEYEGWGMRGKPTPNYPQGIPICVGDGQYKHAVDEGQKMIYSLRDPRHKPHVTMELDPKKYTDPPPFDIEEALNRHGTMHHFPEELKNALREFHNTGNNIYEGTGDIPKLHQILQNWWRDDPNNRPRPLPNGGQINQIQGVGNSIPKPEYQQRMKDWFKTFPPEERPNWPDNESDFQDIAELNPEHPDYEPEWENDDDPDPAMGGYQRHGDYGLEPPPPRPINYLSVLHSMPRQRSHYHHDQHHFDPQDADVLYQEARKRNQIPELAKATEEYNEKVAMPSWEQLEDQNYEYLGGGYPGESYEEDPERWDLEGQQHGLEGPEAFKNAEWGYNDGIQELQGMHPETQITNAIYEKLQPHYAPEGLNGQPPGYYNFSAQTGFADPRAPGTIAKVASAIPPDPGTAPIPEGNVRLYHYTGAEPEQIRQQGIRMQNAKGESYGEPNQIWASASPPSFDNHNVVEFSVPYNDPRWDIGRYQEGTNYGWPNGEDYSPEAYTKLLRDRGSHVTFNGDIRPEEIHAVHEPWHSHYRYLMDNYPDPSKVSPNEFDFVDDPDTARGVQAWKDTLWPPRLSASEKPIYYHGTTRDPSDEDWTHIQPGSAGGNFGESDAGYAYASTDRSAAEWYAQQAHDRQAFSWTKPVVYQVRPTGPVEQDPSHRGDYSRGNFAGDVRSQHPFEITDEHELPGDWHCEHCGSIDHETAECPDAGQWDHQGSVTKLAHPLYQRWAYSPASGEVTLSDNNGDPLDVKYHGDMARDINEPNLVHGYAYRLADGWRLTDWQNKPLTDNFVIAQVMRKLAGSEAPQGQHEGSWDMADEPDFSRLHHTIPS